MFIFERRNASVTSLFKALPLRWRGRGFAIRWRGFAIRWRGFAIRARAPILKQIKKNDIFILVKYIS